jgi:hypothetical protein
MVWVWVWVFIYLLFIYFGGGVGVLDLLQQSRARIDYSLPLGFFFPFIGNVYVAGS